MAAIGWFIALLWIGASFVVPLFRNCTGGETIFLILVGLYTVWYLFIKQHRA